MNFDPWNEIKGFLNDRHEISMTGSRAANIAASCGDSCPADPVLLDGNVLLMEICLKGLPGKCPSSVALANALHHCMGSGMAADGFTGTNLYHPSLFVLYHCLVTVSLGMASYICCSISSELVGVGELSQRTAWH